MAPLSEHYRTDTTDGLPDELRAKLDQHYFKQLPNRTISNPKVLVVFSGGCALGKSTLARKIEAELHGLVLENDAIKSAITGLLPNVERRTRGELMWKYTMDLYARLPKETPNGLVVRDALIDWYFDRILPIFINQGYRIFIIAYDVSREKNEALIRLRGDTSTVSVEQLLELIPEQLVHMNRFRAAYTPDIMLTDENLFDHDMVIERLKAYLST